MVKRERPTSPPPNSASTSTTNTKNNTATATATHSPPWNRTTSLITSAELLQLSSSPTLEDSLVQQQQQQQQQDGEGSPSKKRRGGGESLGEGKGAGARTTKRKEKGTATQSGTIKTRWTPEEDTILLALLERLIKANLWDSIKADGRLVSRTSYGCQYHALMLLKQGSKATSTTSTSTAQHLANGRNNASG